MNQNNKLDVSIRILMFLYLVHGMPVVAIYTPALINAVLIVALFVLLCMKISTKDILKLLPIFIIPILDMLFFSGSGSIVNFLISVSRLMQILIYPLFACLVLKYNDISAAKWSLIIYLLCMFIISITTYYGCSLIPGASRLLATDIGQDNEQFVSIYKLNIGDFSFIYSNVLLTVLYVALFKYRKLFLRRVFHIIPLIAIVVIYLSISASEYTMAFVLFFVSCFLFFMNKKLNSKRVVIILICVCLLFFVFKSVIADVLLMAAQNVVSEGVSVRLSDLASSLSGTNVSVDSPIMIRKEKYLLSYNYFLLHPFGGWGERTINGGHSFVIDNMAKYGIAGLFLVVLMVKKIFQYYIAANKDKPYYGYAVVIWMISCIMIIVNSGIYYTVLTFVLPLASMIFNEYNLNNQKQSNSN